MATKAKTRRTLLPATARTNSTDAADVVEQTTGDAIRLGDRDTSGDGEKVTVVVPKAYQLTLDDHSPVRYEMGTQEMPVNHAAHWFSRAMGVKVYSPE